MESEFLALLSKICLADIATKEEGKIVREFRRLAEHPAGSDLIFYLEDEQDASPEGIVQQVKEWRKANGKPGFRGE